MTRDFELAWWSALDVRLLPSGSVQTLNMIVYHFGDEVDDGNGGRRYVEGPTIIVPEFRVCDLSSQPEYWPLPNKVRGSAGAIVHDELYAHAEEQEAELRRNGWPDFVLDRPQADSLARTVWKCDRLMGRAWSGLYWSGVRVGGQASWDKHRRARAAERAARAF